MNWEPLLMSICEELQSKEGAISSDIRTEEHFERQFVEGVVRDCVKEHSSAGRLGIATHPWVKPGTTKPYCEELQTRIKVWRECKKWANVTSWGMRRTLDIFVWDKETDDHECIAIEVKFCKTKTGRMPTGEFQRMIGQSLLFLGPKNHKAVVAVFGFKSAASAALDDNDMSEALRQRDIWPVVLRVP